MTESVQKQSLENSQNSQENSCARVSFLMKLQAQAQIFGRVLICHWLELCKTHAKPKCVNVPIIKVARYQTIITLNYTLVFLFFVKHDQKFNPEFRTSGTRYLHGML